MWPWVILAIGWAAAGYWSLTSFRRLRMTEPADPVRAITARIKIALGFGVSLFILLALSFGSLQIAIVEKNSPAKIAASLTLFFCLLGGLFLWKWFWKKRPPTLRPPM